MPEYAATAQFASERLPRSAAGDDGVLVIVTADTIAEALTRAAAQIKPRTTAARIVSIEEILTVDADSFSDDQLTQALGSAPVPLAPDDFDDDEVIYERSDFDDIIEQVVTALRESEWVPGIDVSILRSSEGVADYVLVDVHDALAGSYRSVGRELQDLIEYRSMTGWPAVLSVARHLISTASSGRLF